AHEVEQRVLVDGFGAIGLAITAHIGGDSVKASPGEGRQLMPPRVPGLWEAVAEHDQRALALLGEVGANSVRLAEPMPDVAHGIGSSPAGDLLEARRA